MADWFSWDEASVMTESSLFFILWSKNQIFHCIVSDRVANDYQRPSRPAELLERYEEISGDT